MSRSPGIQPTTTGGADLGRGPAVRLRPKAHWDIGENLGILDFERHQLARSRFALPERPRGLLERALVRLHAGPPDAEARLVEVLPPISQ